MRSSPRGDEGSARTRAYADIGEHSAAGGCKLLLTGTRKIEGEVFGKLDCGSEEPALPLREPDLDEPHDLRLHQVDLRLQIGVLGVEVSVEAHDGTEVQVELDG